MPTTRQNPVPPDRVGTDVIMNLLTEIKNQLNECFIVIKNQSEKINILQEEINALQNKSPVAEGNNDRVTYADSLKKQKHVLVVKSKIGKEVSAVEDDIKNNLCPEELQIGLNIEKKTKDGGLLVKCSDEEALKTVESNLKSKIGNDYDIKVPKKFLPRIIITGINESDEKGEELISKIIKQNKLPQTSNFKFEKVFTTKVRKSRFNLVAEVDPQTFQNITVRSPQELYIGWNICKVYEFFHVKRCFQCGGFNHEAKNCSEKVTCLVCAGEHKSKVCKSVGKKCANCIRANQQLNLNLDVDHTTMDKNCKCYLRVVHSIQRKTNYSEGK